MISVIKALPLIKGIAFVAALPVIKASPFIKALPPLSVTGHVDHLARILASDLVFVPDLA